MHTPTNKGAEDASGLAPRPSPVGGISKDGLAVLRPDGLLSDVLDLDVKLK